MIIFLRCLFAAILIAMLVGTGWAMAQEGVFEGGARMMPIRWAVMTLLDAYFGFITFFVWVAYKETSNAARLVSFVAIMLLGNMAMATYMLIQLFRVPADASLDRVFLRRSAA